MSNRPNPFLPLCILLSLGGALAAQAPFADTTQQRLPALGGLAKVRVLDLDGDGHQDILAGVLRGLGDKLALNLWRNDGRGYFPALENLAPASAVGELQDFALLDYDRDGDTDILAVYSSRFVSDGGPYLLENDGSGRFTDVTARRIPPILMNAHRIDVGDINGDGYLDALVIGYFFAFLGPIIDDPPIALLGTPSGDFVLDPRPMGVGGSLLITVADMALADMNGDGFPDAVLTTSGWDEKTHVWLNDRGGHFTWHAAIDQAAGIPESPDVLAPADYDGDGDLDLVVGRLGPNALYLNDGRGALEDASDRLPSAGGAVSVVPVDHDRDGDLDLLMGFSSGDPATTYVARYFENDGSAFFKDRTAELLPPPYLGGSLGIGYGDLDGDGDSDLVTTTRTNVFDTEGELYMNLARQVFGAPEAFQGSPYRVLVTSAPLHTMFLGISAGIRPMDLGLLGILWLDPAATAMFPARTVPESGWYHEDIDVPFDLTLMGQVFHFQALDVDLRLVEPRLSNTYQVTVLHQPRDGSSAVRAIQQPMLWLSR